MKTSKFYIAMATVALVLYACNPIEDTSLRDDFANPGTPITQAELDAAVSVTQPIQNSDTKIEGDQYVVVKNNRKDVPGVWHIATATGDKIVGSDQDTIVYGSNGTFGIYYVGLSAQKVVTSKTFTVKVTNVFDPFISILTGAKDKTDKTAKKTWVADANSAGNFSYINGHGIWHAYPEGTATGWWATVALRNVPDQEMNFVFDGDKLVTYAAGQTKAEGSYAVTHDTKGAQEIQGELITTTPLVGNYGSVLWGGPADQYLGSSPYKYWIISLSDTKMFIAHPSNFTNPSDWDDECTYQYFKVKE